MPRLRESDVENAARSYKAKTGVGCECFHPKVPLGLEKETRRGVAEFLEKCGRWP